MIEAKDTEIAALRTSYQAQLDALRAQVAVLIAEVADLRARLGQNPRNSSNPPSSEGIAKPAPRSLRGKSGRRPGRPKGQPGATLQMSGRPDGVVTHEPGRCAACGAGLSYALVTRAERRQVVDLARGHPGACHRAPDHLPQLRVRHGHRRPRAGRVPAPVQYGPRISAACAYLWHGQFLSRGRTCEAVSELLGVPVSPGAVAGMMTRTAGALGASLDAIRKALAATGVAHFDDTGFRVAGKLAWVQQWSHRRSSAKRQVASRGAGQAAQGQRCSQRATACSAGSRVAHSR